MRNTNDSKYGFSDFVRDFEIVSEGSKLDYEMLVRKYFSGELDDFVQEVEDDAFDRSMDASERRIHGESGKIMPDFLTAAMRCPLFLRGVFIAFLDVGAEQFLRNVEGVLREDGMRDRLDALMLDRTIPLEDRRSIARIIDYDFDGVIEGRTVSSTNPVEATSTRVTTLYDLALRGRTSDELREGAFPATDRRLTVTEARRRVMARTGQSERSIIRQTKGWTADKIIALIG